MANQYHDPKKSIAKPRWNSADEKRADEKQKTKNSWSHEISPNEKSSKPKKWY